MPQKKPATATCVNPDEMETQIPDDIFEESGTLQALNADKKKRAKEGPEEEEPTDDELLEDVAIHEDPFIPEPRARKRPASNHEVSKDVGEGKEEQEGEEEANENDEDPCMDRQEGEDFRQEGGSMKAPCLFQ